MVRRKTNSTDYLILRKNDYGISEASSDDEESKHEIRMYSTEKQNLFQSDIPRVESMDLPESGGTGSDIKNILSAVGSHN